MYSLTAQELGEIDVVLARMDAPRPHRASEIVRSVAVQKHKKVNFDSPIETPASPKSPLDVAGPAAPEREAHIDGVSNTHPYPVCPIPTSTHHHKHEDLDGGAEIGIDEGAKRTSETDRSATAERSDAPPSSKGSLLDLIREAKDRYYKPRLPDRIPHKPSCNRARAKSHRTQPRAVELPPLQQLRRANYSMDFQASAGATHVGFSINLDYKTEKLALTKPDPFDWLYRRLRHELGDLCKLFVILSEHAPVKDSAERARRLAHGLPQTKRLHLHGELVCRPGALGAYWRPYQKGWASTGPELMIFNAFLRAAGAWDDPSHQIDFIASPGERWLTRYVTKQGVRYKMTGDLRRLWKEDYKYSREMANTRIKRVHRERERLAET